MPIINKSVNKTTVNGSESFIYTFNVSFSGLVNPASNGKMIDFFPYEVNYQLPPLGGQLISIDEVPTTGGTNVVFNFGSVTAGTSISFTVACQFGVGREQGDSFTNIADLYADDIKVATTTAQTVSLILDNNFVLIKIPNITGGVRPNQEITFQLILQNLNDPGYRINNIVINDVLPPQLTAVTSFLPIGTDTSTSGFPDRTYNGRTGSFTGNTLNFTLPSYNGSGYTILFKATVKANVVPGERITNTAKWSVDGVFKPDATTTFQVFEDKASAVVIKRAPLYAAPGSSLQYTISSTNIGTVPLTNYNIIDTPPVEVNLTKISFTVATTTAPVYSLFVATSDNPALYKTVATNISGTSPVFDLTSFIPANQRVTSVKAVLPTINPINTAAIMILFGNISSSATQGSVITNQASITGSSSIGNVSQTSLASTTLNGKSVLQITKSISPQSIAFHPLDEFRIHLQATTQKGMIFNPTFSDLLPLGIEYVPDSEYYIYFDSLAFKSFDSRNPDFPIALPTIQVIKNYEGTGRTLVRYYFSDFLLLYTNNLVVNFGVLVKLNPPSSFTNYGYLGNPGSNTEVDGIAYLDSADFDGDGITNEQIAQSNAVTGSILTTSEFSLEKWVKGNLDTTYSKSASSTSGGDVNYQLAVTNNQDIDLKNIEIVDILPYVGDTGVILNTTPRGSQFAVYATSVVTAEIINILGDPVDPNPTIIIEYSTSNNPIRFDETGTGTIGTGSWSLVPPVDVTTIRSIKVTTGADVILKPYERLLVTIFGKTPNGTPLNLLAYNSFALKADKVTSGGITPMNPAEPNKVSVQIKSSTLGSIGQFVWNDLNKNGLYEPGEPGINGVTVMLYDENMKLLDTTVTANNNLNMPGYYQFSGLSAGNYFVQFTLLTDYSFTIQQTEATNGSKPNPTTGITNLITLTQNEATSTINAGLIQASCDAPVINATNKCLHVGDTFIPLNGVTAYDCDGNNITEDIIIIENDVDTEVAGTYHVTYQVTDSFEQTTDKRIVVRVCQGSKRMQAITDIFESVALEQTALSHILNAEGEKLQKIISMNPTPQQMLLFNDSVQTTVHSITLLETVLYGKMELFKNSAGKDCCDS